MADSDNSTSPSNVTRRRLLAGTIVAALPVPAAAGATAEPPASRDMVLTLWRAWNEAHAETNALCRRQQGLESKLVRTVGFPRVEVRLPDKDHTTLVSWPSQIDNLFGDDPAFAGLRAKTEAELAAHQARWEEADSKLGYSAAKRAEERAARHEARLAKALCATPASSLAGVAAKLDAIIQRGQWRSDCPEFPWPELRAVLNDVKAMGGKIDQEPAP